MALPGRILLFVGLALLTIGLVLHIVGLATPGWTVKHAYNQEMTSGLWETCFGSKCQERTSKDSNIQAAGAFAIIGMLLSIAGLTLAFLHFLLGLLGKFQHRLLLLGSLVANIVAPASILISVIIWGAGVYDSSQGDLGYSFALSFVGGILIAGGGVLVFLKSI